MSARTARAHDSRVWISQSSGWGTVLPLMAGSLLLPGRAGTLPSASRESSDPGAVSSAAITSH